MLQQEQDQFQLPPQNGNIERATDPRKQPTDAAPTYDNTDYDRELAKSGGSVMQQEASSRDETPIGSRPNPNKHEDGYVSNSVSFCRA